MFFSTFLPFLPPCSFPPSSPFSLPVLFHLLPLSPFLPSIKVHLDQSHWLKCVLLGAVSLPVGGLMRFIPCEDSEDDYAAVNPLIKMKAAVKRYGSHCLILPTPATFSSFYLITSHLILSIFILSHLILSHFISSHLISSHLMSSQYKRRQHDRPFLPLLAGDGYSHSNRDVQIVRAALGAIRHQCHNFIRPLENQVMLP